MRWVIHAMDRPGVAARRADLAAAHVSYLACQGRVAVVVEGALLAAEDGPLFGQMYVVEGSARSEVDAFLAAHPYRRHGIWRQVLVRPMQDAAAGAPTSA